jgi:hypothetical protein
MAIPQFHGVALEKATDIVRNFIDVRQLAVTDEDRNDRSAAIQRLPDLQAYNIIFPVESFYAVFIAECLPCRPNNCENYVAQL